MGSGKRRKEKPSQKQAKAERHAAALSEMKPRRGCNWKKVYLCLIMFAESAGLSVQELSLVWYDGFISDQHIAIRSSLKSSEERARNLAHEIGHWFLLRDNPRNLVRDPDPEEEERADKVGELLISFARFTLDHGIGLPCMNDD